MKTKELIEWLEKGKKEKQTRIVKWGKVTYEIDTWWDEDERVLNELIKRLEELEELKFRLKEMKMLDYVDQATIKGFLKV